MGRHAKGARRRRFSTSTVVLGSLIVMVVAVGSVLSSRAQPTPIAAHGIDTTAIVVSSPVCDGHSSSTLVDVANPAGTTVRTTLDTCGYREGEQLPVRFAAGDPTQLTPASNDAADDGVPGGRFLPYGIVVALFLAIAAAVWIDGRRRSRDHGLGATARHQVDDSDDSSGLWPWLTAAAQSKGSTGRHAWPDDVSADGWGNEPSPEVPPNDGSDPVSIVVSIVASIGVSTGVLADPADGTVGSRGLTSIDRSFPATASLAASLRDELFTHRSDWAGSR